MAIATFNGVAIFGSIGVTMSTSNNPRSKQDNAYFGLSGVESLDGGLRGRFTEVEGVLAGVGMAAFAAAEESFRAYHNGLYYVLVDTRGWTWPWVRMERFEPQGKVRRSSEGEFFRPFKATFMHLT